MRISVTFEASSSSDDGRTNPAWKRVRALAQKKKVIHETRDPVSPHLRLHTASRQDYHVAEKNWNRRSTMTTKLPSVEGDLALFPTGPSTGLASESVTFVDHTFGAAGMFTQRSQLWELIE